MQVSRDVVFDEMSCWYGPANVTEDADAGNGNVAVNVEQQSQSLSGPGESLTNGSNAWTVRLRSSGSNNGSPDSGAQISRKGNEKLDPSPLFVCYQDDVQFHFVCRLRKALYGLK